MIRLLIKYELLDNEKYLVSEKIKRVKIRLARLIARDIIYHAVMFNCKQINMENLMFISTRFASKWNVGEIYDYVKQEASAYGIKVVRVSARDTSHTDPFTQSHVNPDNNRLVSTSIGKLDRDNVIAPLNIAARSKNTGCKQKQIKPDKRKTRPTPRRAHAHFKKQYKPVKLNRNTGPVTSKATTLNTTANNTQSTQLQKRPQTKVTQIE